MSAYTPGGATRTISPPKLPPVVTPKPTVNPTTVAGVLESVDNPASPTIASFVVNGSYPALSGFVWNSALAVTVAMAPVTPAAPPTGTVYYNNSTTHEGGTIFYIDTVSRTIVSATSNFSTVAGVNYSLLFQDIVHNGAYNSTGGFQNPNPLDVTSLLGNPSLTTAPVLIPPLPYIHAYVGANGVISSGGAYDAQVVFNTQLDNPNWMQELRLYANAGGGKADNVPPATLQSWVYKTTVAPSTTGQYAPWFHGLVSGVSYDLYVAFVDLRGQVSYGRYLCTTAANPVSLVAGNMPNMGNPTLINPAVISHGLEVVEGGAAGATAFDYLIPSVALDSNGYSTNNWLLEIELVYCNTETPTNVCYSNTVTVQPSGTYQFVYPQLPVGLNADGTIMNYQLGLRYVDFAGQRSNAVFYDTVNSSTLQVGSPTLQTIPNGTTFSVNYGGIGSEPAPTNNGGSNFAQNLYFNLVINSSVPYIQWLDKIQLLAKEQPTGVPDSDANPANYVKVGQINGNQFTNPINQSFGPLGNNSIWQLAIQLIDHSGIFTPALPIYLCGLSQTSAYTGPGPTNTNFIGDSDMTYTNGYQGTSVYWEYKNYDPTRFHVVNSVLTADAHGGSTSVGPVCAYTDLINVITGQVYTLSVSTNLNDNTGGNQSFGICDKSDVVALNATPQLIYLSSLNLPVSGSTTSRNSITWTSTVTGPIACYFFANNIKGSCNWSKPQFELGSTATAYKSGTLATNATATIAHTAQSTQVQQTINNQGQLSVSNVQSSSRLALPNSAGQIQDVITDPGTGRGNLNVAPVGGTTGSLPYPNIGTAGQLTYGTGGASNNGLIVAVQVGGLTTAGTNTISATPSNIALPSGGTWTYVCKAYIMYFPTANTSVSFSGGYVGTYSNAGSTQASVNATTPLGVVIAGEVVGCPGGQTVGLTAVQLLSATASTSYLIQFEAYAFRTGN